MTSLSAVCTGGIYPYEIPLVLISIIGLIDPRAIVRPEGLSQRRVPITSSESELATYCKKIPL
jgi:hypothetical protein